MQRGGIKEFISHSPAIHIPAYFYFRELVPASLYLQ